MPRRKGWDDYGLAHEGRKAVLGTLACSLQAPGCLPACLLVLVMCIAVLLWTVLAGQFLPRFDQIVIKFIFI